MEIRFEVSDEEYSKRSSLTTELTSEYARACSQFLNIYTRGHPLLQTIKITHISLSCVRITSTVLCGLFCLSNLQSLSLDDVNLTVTGWGSTVKDLPAPTLKELKFIGPSQEMQLYIRTIIAHLGSSLTILRIHNPDAWSDHRARLGNAFATCRHLFNMYGLQQDPAGYCPNLSQVEFIAPGMSTGSSSCEILELALPPVDDSVAEGVARLWDRRFSLQFGDLEPMELPAVKGLAWTAIFG